MIYINAAKGRLPWSPLPRGVGGGVSPAYHQAVRAVLTPLSRLRARYLQGLETAIYGAIFNSVCSKNQLTFISMGIALRNYFDQEKA